MKGRKRARRGPMTQKSAVALIVAAGSGSRMGGDIPKQFRPIGGKAVLAHAVDALASHPAIDAVRVVVGDGQQEMARNALGARQVGELVVVFEFLLELGELLF